MIVGRAVALRVGRSAGVPAPVRRGGRVRGVAVLGLLGVSAQPGITLAGYLPTVLGLLFGYLILGALLERLRRWRAHRPAIPWTGAAS